MHTTTAMARRLPYTPSWNRPVLLLVAFFLFSLALPIQADSQKHLQAPPGIHDAVREAAHPVATGSADSSEKQRGSQALNDGTTHNNDNRASSDTSSNKEPSSPPEYVPLVTPAPDQDAALASKGFRQVTFYTCNTVAGQQHCGWHVPIVKAQGIKRDSGTVFLAVAVLAGVFAMGLM